MLDELAPSELKVTWERKALLNPLFLFFLQHFISFAMGSTQSKSAQPVIFYNQSSPLQVNESQCGRVEIHVIISFFFFSKKTSFLKP